MEKIERIEEYSYADGIKFLTDSHPFLPSDPVFTNARDRIIDFEKWYDVSKFKITITFINDVVVNFTASADSYSGVVFLSSKNPTVGGTPGPSSTVFAFHERSCHENAPAVMVSANSIQMAIQALTSVSLDIKMDMTRLTQYGDAFDPDPANRGELHWTVDPSLVGRATVDVPVRQFNVRFLIPDEGVYNEVNQGLMADSLADVIRYLTNDDTIQYVVGITEVTSVNFFGITLRSSKGHHFEQTCWADNFQQVVQYVERKWPESTIISVNMLEPDDE